MSSSTIINTPVPRQSVFISRRNTIRSDASWTSFGTFEVAEVDIYGDLLELDKMTPDEYRQLFQPPKCCDPNLDYSGKFFIGRKFKLAKNRNAFTVKVILLSLVLKLSGCAGVLATIFWDDLRLHLVEHIVIYYATSIVTKSAVYILVRIVKRGKFFPWNWSLFSLMVIANLFASSVLGAFMELLGSQLLYLERHKAFKSTSGLNDLVDHLRENYRLLMGERKSFTAWEQLLSFCIISLSNLLCFIYITGIRGMTGDPTDDPTTALATVPNVLVTMVLLVMTFLGLLPLTGPITWLLIQIHFAFFRTWLMQHSFMNNCKLLFQGELDSIDADMWVYFTMRVNLHPLFLLV